MSDETMINTKLERLQQLEAANEALHVQWRKNKKSKKSAKRAEKTAMVTAETNARPRTMPSVRASVDTKLISKPEAFSVKDQWPRWLLTMKEYLGAVSGGLAENVDGRMFLLVSTISGTCGCATLLSSTSHSCESIAEFSRSSSSRVFSATAARKFGSIQSMALVRPS